MVLMTQPDAAALYERVDETDPNLYGSIAEMVAANAGRPFPTRAPKARKLVAKLRGAS